MEADDVGVCEELWHHAWEALCAAHALPAPGATGEDRARLCRRIEHLRRTDPGGSWVAVDDGAVRGLAQALLREGLWVLSLLGVAVSSQSQGVGRALLEQALAYGGSPQRGLILSSPDPRAMHRYAAAGFALLPTVVATGTLDHARLPDRAAPEVRRGTGDDLAHVAGLGRGLRGAAHGPDIEFLLAEGAQLLVAEEGFALFGAVRPILLAATDEETAAALLRAGFAAMPDGSSVEAMWITGQQQWAIRLCVELGLELHPAGAVMVRGEPGPLAPYLPSGAFG